MTSDAQLKRRLLEKLQGRKCAMRECHELAVLDGALCRRHEKLVLLAQRYGMSRRTAFDMLRALKGMGVEP